MTIAASPIDPDQGPQPMNLPTPALPVIPNRVVDIRAHGAVGDGTTMNTAAIAASIAALADAGGGRVLVPAGIWLTGAIHFRSQVELFLEEGAELRFSQNPRDYLPVVLMQRGGVWCHNYSPFLYARDCHDVAITGRGTLNGQGQSWWPWKKNQPGMLRLREMVAARTPIDQRVFGTVEAGVRPSFFQFIGCRNVLLDGVSFVDSPSWTLHPVQCENLTIRGVTVRNPSNAPNTDGIDPDASRNVLIEHCLVDTGDDGICLKSGWNEDGWDAGRPCENVTVRHCTVLAGHGGVVIGSDVSGGIQNVHAHDCVFKGTSVGVRIKTKPGRGGYVRNVLCERLNMRDIRSQAVLVTQWYQGNPHDTTPINPSLPLTDISNLTLHDITCNHAAEAVVLRGMPARPFRNITLGHVNITAIKGMTVEATEGFNTSDVTIKSLTSC